MRFSPSDITYCESVFRKSANENVEVFSTGWTIRNNTHFRIDTCGRSHFAYPYPISIRVWGIVSFIFQLGLSTTFIRINEVSSILSFLYYQINLLELRIIDIMKQLEKHLHEQYAINNNSKTSSLIAILAAVMIAFTAFGYVLYHSPHSINMLLCASNAVIGVIILLYIVATYLGTDQRKEQFISFAIRVKDYKIQEYNSIFPKNYNPFHKTLCNFVQGLYNLLSVALVCCLIAVVITTIWAKGRYVDCPLFHCCWAVSLMYMLYYRLKKYQEYLKLEQEYKDKYTLEENPIIKDILKRERPCCIKQFFSKCCKHFTCIVFPYITMILSIVFFFIFRHNYPSESILVITSVIFFFAGLYTMLIIINSDK